MNFLLKNKWKVYLFMGNIVLFNNIHFYCKMFVEQ